MNGKAKRDAVLGVVAAAVLLLVFSFIVSAAVYVIKLILEGKSFEVILTAVIMTIDVTGWSLYRGVPAFFLSLAVPIIIGIVFCAIGAVLMVNLPVWVGILVSSWVAGTVLLLRLVIESDNYDEVEVLQGRGKF